MRVMKCPNFRFIQAAILIAFIFCQTSPIGAESNPTSSSNTDVIFQVQNIQDSQKEPLQIQSKPEVEEEKKSEAESPDLTDSFVLKKIEFEGNQTIDTEKLQSMAAELENTVVTFQQLKDLAQKITATYRSQGYLLTRAYLPPQKILNGEVLIQILEGKTGEIDVQDNRWFKKKIYENYFQNLNQEKAFQYNDLEGALYSLNKKSDRQAKAYLSPGKKPGTSDLVLKVKERFPFHASYEFNNHGTKFTNRARHMMHYSATNFLGFDDVLKAGFSLAEQSAFRANWIQYRFPFQTTGTELGLDWTLANTRLTKDLRPFDIESHYLELTPSIAQALIRHRTFYLGWNGAFEIKDAKSTTANVKTYYDRMRVIRTGPRLDWQDRFGKTILSSDVHIGLGNFMGSLKKDDPNSSRSGGGGAFAYYTASIARLQRMPLSTYLTLQANGQWSPVRLTSLEQFRAGGSSSVRGYPESDSAGDRGYVASAEFNFPVPFFPQEWHIPYLDKTWNECFRIIGFYDLGQTSNRSRILFTDEKNRFLMGAGYGIRINIRENFRLQLDVGYPIGNESTDKDRPQIHLSSKAGF